MYQVGLIIYLKENEMGILNINLDEFIPSSLRKSVTPTGQPVLPKISTPTRVQSQGFKPKQEINKSWMQKGFEALAIPSELTEKFVTKNQGYEKALENVGLKNKTAQKVLAFGGKMVLDPLNFIPFGLVGKGLRKIPGLIEGAKFVGKAVKGMGKIPLPKFIFEGGVIKTGLTSLEGVAKNLGEKFLPNFGKPELYGMMKKEIPTKFGIGAEKIITNVKSIFKDVKPDEYRVVADALEQIPFIKGRAVKGDITKLASEVGTDRFKNIIMPVVRKTQEIFRGELDDLLKRGQLDKIAKREGISAEEIVKKLISRGGYYPHLDYASETLKKYFLKIPQFAEKRSYLLENRDIEGFSKLAPKVIAKRELNQLQDNIIQDFLKDVKTRFGVQVSAKTTVPQGFMDFVNAPERLKELNGWSLPANIAKDITDSFDATNPLGVIGQGLDVFNRFWKPTATSMNPAFHFINVMGNLYNSWLGGMKNPIRFLQGLDPRALVNEMTPFNEAEKFILKKSGILTRGQFGVDLVDRTFGNAEGIDTIRLFEFFRKIGNNFENNARSAFFLDQRGKFLKKGLSEIEATRQAIKNVNEYLFDYLTGLTPFETNIMRRFFPFYTWARFNIPLQFKSLITQPQKVAVVSKLYKILNEGGVPESDQAGITFPTPFTDADGNPIRYKPNLPLQDIFNLLRRPFDSLSPAIKEGFELLKYAGTTMTGKPQAPIDYYTGKPRTDVDLPFRTQVGDIIKSETKSLLRPFRSYTKVEEEGFSPSSILRQASGGFYSVKQQQQYDMQKIKRKRDIDSATLQRIRRIRLDNTLTLEEKNKAIDFLRQYKQK